MILLKNRNIFPAYTLLELLVVLLIVSLLTALVFPRLVTLYQSFQLAYTRDDIIAQVGSLGYQAFQQGRYFKLFYYPPEIIENSLENVEQKKEELQEPLPLELPAGWRISTETPIHFQANGVCNGGTVFLHYQEQSYKIQLIPPFCQASR